VTSYKKLKTHRVLSCLVIMWCTFSWDHESESNGRWKSIISLPIFEYTITINYPSEYIGIHFHQIALQSLVPCGLIWMGRFIIQCVAHIPANQIGKSWRVSSYSNWTVQFLELLPWLHLAPLYNMVVWIGLCYNPAITDTCVLNLHHSGMLAYMMTLMN